MSFPISNNHGNNFDRHSDETSFLYSTAAQMKTPASYVTAEEIRKEYPDCYIKIRPQERSSLSQFPLKTNEDWTETTFPEQFVLTLPHGKVFGPHGVSLTKDGSVLADTAQEWRPIEQHSIFQRNGMPRLQRFEGKLAVIASNGADSYYHWMFEILPRLKILQESGISYDKIYVPRLRYPFQKNTLEHLGIHHDLYVEGQEETYIQADELIVPSLPNRKYSTHPLWVCHYLRGIFLNKDTTQSHSECLYISRKVVTSQSSRKIVNEDEVFAFLEKKGFQKVVLEELTVKEQAELFASAKVVVAAHGAGLSNLVFCSPKTKVIEIFSPNHLDETFWFLSHQMGFEHICLEPPTEMLSISQKECCDMYLPIDLLAHSL